MTRTTLFRTTAMLLLAVVVATAGSGCGRVAPRVGRRAAVAVSERMTSVLARDRMRDSASRVVRLTESRSVFRFVTPSTARVEMREGFRAGTHFTSRATPGRPPSPATVAERYGVEANRTRRILATLPEGTAVRRNKVIGGAPGVGEVTIAQPLPPRVIDRVVRLPAP